MRTVIFDLDGTLADTATDMINAANVCFQRLGLGAVLDRKADARTAMMGGGRALLALGFERAETGWGADRVLQHYPDLLSAYGRNVADHSTLYPGVTKALAALQGQGYALGVCTNKPAGLADDLLQKLGVRHHFAALVGADTFAVRKPDPMPLLGAITQAGGQRRHALLVGDSPTDRQTARAAGVPSVLVTFGPDGQNVAALEPDALLGDYRHLPDLAARILA